MTSGAIFSPCRTWRYKLWRSWDESLPTVAFIGLNPSTADETANDPTIRRCIGFAKSWGYGTFVMLNLFGYRATDPRELYTTGSPELGLTKDFFVGPDNDSHILTESAFASRVVAAWGNHGALYGRAKWAIDNISKLHHLGLTHVGQPKHPLYLSKSLVPQPFELSARP